MQTARVLIFMLLRHLNVLLLHIPNSKEFWKKTKASNVFRNKTFLQAHALNLAGILRTCLPNRALDKILLHLNVISFYLLVESVYSSESRQKFDSYFCLSRKYWIPVLPYIQLSFCTVHCGNPNQKCTLLLDIFNLSIQPFFPSPN